MKVFWIGEESEMFAGNSIEEILAYHNDKYMQQDVNDGCFGEVTDLSIVVRDEEDPSISYTLAEMIEGAESVTQLTTQCS